MRASADPQMLATYSEVCLDQIETWKVHAGLLKESFDALLGASFPEDHMPIGPHLREDYVERYRTLIDRQEAIDRWVGDVGEAFEAADSTEGTVGPVVSVPAEGLLFVQPLDEQLALYEARQDDGAGVANELMARADHELDVFTALQSVRLMALFEEMGIMEKLQDEDFAVGFFNELGAEGIYMMTVAHRVHPPDQHRIESAEKFVEAFARATASLDDGILNAILDWKPFGMHERGFLFSADGDLYDPRFLAQVAHRAVYYGEPWNSYSVSPTDALVLRALSGNETASWLFATMTDENGELLHVDFLEGNLEYRHEAPGSMAENWLYFPSSDTDRWNSVLWQGEVATAEDPEAFESDVRALTDSILGKAFNYAGITSEERQNLHGVPQSYWQHGLYDRLSAGPSLPEVEQEDITEPDDPRGPGESPDPRDPADPGDPAEVPEFLDDRDIRAGHNDSFWAVAEDVLINEYGTDDPSEDQIFAYWEELKRVNESILPEPGNVDLVYPTEDTGKAMRIPNPVTVLGPDPDD